MNRKTFPVPPKYTSQFLILLTVEREARRTRCLLAEPLLSLDFPPSVRLAAKELFSALAAFNSAARANLDLPPPARESVLTDPPAKHFSTKTIATPKGSPRAKTNPVL